MRVSLIDHAERIRKLEALAERPGTTGEGGAARAALDRIWARLKPDVVRHRPCVWCNSDQFSREPGKGPHAAHLRCQGCGRGDRWLSRSAVAALSRGAA